LNVKKVFNLIADLDILNLNKVVLQAKQILPEYSGIYYVLDETNNVWYIGKAKNLRKRWQGKAHHRIYQLESQKKKYFTIYYEQVRESQLDSIEKQRIEKYHPHLNTSPVKTKNVRPTETLLRETLVAIADFAFILGVEPPRKEIQTEIALQAYKLGQKKVLDSTVIHVCIDRNLLKNIYHPESIEESTAIINRALMSRKKYANKWHSFRILRFRGLSRSFSNNYFDISRLFVNGYVIEITNWIPLFSEAESKFVRECQLSTLAQESIKALTPKSLAQLQQRINTKDAYNLYLRRLNPYTSDLIKLFFNEAINRENAKNELVKLSQNYKLGKRGFGSRSKTVDIDELLVSRGIKLNKYERSKVKLLSYSRDKLGVYIQCFSVDLKTSPHYGTFAQGIIDNQETKQLSNQFQIVYFLTGVDRKAWLLVEKYLKDFAKPATKLNNGEGYLEKFYISPRKYIVPAKVNIKLEKIGYSAWIPFGLSEEFPTFETAKQEIRRRLQNSDLPELKITFKRETIAK
jgi:predicted GIY-YIG superfamily endonuclease